MATQPTSAATEIRVRVLAFARVREIAGASELERAVGSAATLSELWADLVNEMPGLADFSSSIRFARNGQLVDADAPLQEGDEIALLPPVSGG
ncbi:MAG: MoaD/ThiS family protein [Candidatus Eremiobacteraeota bacterium]|nr:MoaD/ThiS family protein [Candidatus Eremiobacteraeota bacterium]